MKVKNSVLVLLGLSLCFGGFANYANADETWFKDDDIVTLTIYEGRDIDIDLESPVARLSNVRADLRGGKDSVALRLIDAHNRVSGNVKLLEVEYRTAAGESRDLALPSELRARLLNYLKEVPQTVSREINRFDCTCFAFYLHGTNPKEVLVPRFPGVFALHLPPDAEVIGTGIPTEATLEQGSIVAMPGHTAVYIGNGLYLSKLGSNGLVVTNFSALADLFSPFFAPVYVSGAKDWKDDVLTIKILSINELFLKFKRLLNKPYLNSHLAIWFRMSSDFFS